MLQDAEVKRAIAQYSADGATVLRNVIDTKWTARLGVAIDRLMDSGKSGRSFSEAGEARFFGDHFSWLHQPEFKAFIFESGVAEIAGKVMQSHEVRFFYDQLLVKEPGAARRTPWHQDLPYWPVSGEQIISIWVPIDPASPENGVVTYVKGSHRWNRFFPIQPFAEGGQAFAAPEPTDTQKYDRDDETGVWGSLADIRDQPDKYEFLSWSVEPGDVILHHPLTIHGAAGNMSAMHRRRALATRWFGDDARWNNTRPHFMRRMRKEPAFPYPELEQGDKIEAELFPKVWEVT